MKVVARMARPVELRGSADYLISAELGNEIVGGRCALTVTVGSYPPKTVQFFIRGKEVREGPNSNLTVADPPLEAFLGRVVLFGHLSEEQSTVYQISIRQVPAWPNRRQEGGRKTDWRREGLKTQPEVVKPADNQEEKHTTMPAVQGHFFYVMSERRRRPHRCAK